MPTPKWLVIARNEYRINTSSIRRIRPYFPYLIIGLLAVYVTCIAPALVSLFIDEALAFFLSQAAIAMIQIILFTIFIYFVVIPISNTLREEQTEHVEIFLAAPVKSSDVLLGKFLGMIPLYAIVVTVIVGLFTAIMNPLGLDNVQISIVIMIFILTFFSAFWIGEVIAALLRTRLGRTARGKDIGRALSLIIALPLVALMWAIFGGGLLEALADPGTSGTVKAILDLLPSSWGAEVIIGFILNPGDIGTIAFETLTRFGGLVAFCAAVLWLGTKAAGRAYSLEPTTFTSSRAKPDGAFYKKVKILVGGTSFGTLLVSIFKDYGRRLENLSRIVYGVGLIVLMNLFLIAPDDPTDALIPQMFLIPLLAAMVVSDVTLRGKEALFIYRKAPSGEGKLIKARLLQGLLVVVPIATVIIAVSTILAPHVTYISLLTNAGSSILIAAAYVVFALGLFFLIPAYSQQSAWFNIFLVPQVSLILFIVSAIVLDTMLAIVPLSWLVAISSLYFGKRKLSKME